MNKSARLAGLDRLQFIHPCTNLRNYEEKAQS